MVHARPTTAEKRVVNKARSALKAPKYTRAGRWTWNDVVAVCKLALLELHADAEASWFSQKLSPTHRRIKLSNGKTPWFQSILSGNTSGIKMTDEQKAAVNAQISATHKAREYGQQNWLEPAATAAFINLLQEHYPDQFDVSAMFDGLGADVLIKRKGTGDAWAAVQVKSSRAHPGEVLHFHLKKTDGALGGRYEHMIIWGLGVDPACNRPVADDGFGAVAAVVLKDILVYQNAGEIPGKVFYPFPRRPGKKDKYGVHRYTVDRNTEEDLNATLTLAVQQIDTAPKFTRYQAWFDPALSRNVKATDSHKIEVNNIKALAVAIGFDNITAPIVQNETVDIILTLGDISANVSIKTASLNDGNNGTGYFFASSVAPNSQFCDVVMVFYVNRKTGQRTHVSVIDARTVYDTKKTSFCWGNKKRPEIGKTKINLTSVNVLELIKQAIQQIQA